MLSLSPPSTTYWARANSPLRSMMTHRFLFQTRPTATWREAKSMTSRLLNSVEWCMPVLALMTVSQWQTAASRSVWDRSSLSGQWSNDGKGFADKEMLELPVVTYSEKALTSWKQFENGENLEDRCTGCIYSWWHWVIPAQVPTDSVKYMGTIQR